MLPVSEFIIAAAAPDSKHPDCPTPGQWISQTLRVPSRQIVSNQQYLHPRLADVVLRHLRVAYRKPVAAHNTAAFEQLLTALAAEPRPLVLDSFCGTGHSTACLAERHPRHLVVGIDKSARRLAKHPDGAGADYLLLQADCEDIWQLLVAHGISVDYHYILYPNPWPKAAHLQRRVHGHASFPLLLRLATDSAGGLIELRSNWQVYVEEFGVAMNLAGAPGQVAQLPSGPPLTLFERKYRDSGHTLWCYRATVRC